VSNGVDQTGAHLSWCRHRALRVYGRVGSGRNEHRHLADSLREHVPAMSGRRGVLHDVDAQRDDLDRPRSGWTEKSATTGRSTRGSTSILLTIVMSTRRESTTAPCARRARDDVERADGPRAPASSAVETPRRSPRARDYFRLETPEAVVVVHQDHDVGREGRRSTSSTARSRGTTAPSTVRPSYEVDRRTDRRDVRVATPATIQPRRHSALLRLPSGGRPRRASSLRRHSCVEPVISAAMC